MMKLCTVIMFCLLGILGCSGGGSGGSGAKGATGKTLTSIVITPADNLLAVGLQKQFTAMGTYSDGEARDLTADASWSSSDPTVVSVSNDPASKGMVKILALAAQPVVVTATFDTVSGQANLAVRAKELVTIAVTPVNPVMAAGTAQSFTATGTYSDSTTADITGSVQWSSSLLSVATVDGTGKATGVAAGTTIVTAMLESKSGTTNLNVTPAVLQSISITPASVTLAAGTSRQFTATGTFSDGSTQDLTTAVTWGSSAPSVATVSATGLAAALATGSATINASSGTVSQATALTVTAATLQSVEITPSSINVAAGVTRQLQAVGTYSDGSVQNISASANWSSSVPSVATISPDGLLMAADAGTAAITASVAGLTALRDISVTPANVSGTWTGTYTIHDAPRDPSQVGTYPFRFDLVQNGSEITGTATLRGTVDGQLKGTISGRLIDFQFTYLSPFSDLIPVLMEDLGQLKITDAVMEGSAVENYNAGFNCSYVFSITKQP